jgi:hypothetical protein
MAQMKKVKRPKIGDYVLLAKWSDKALEDPWVVGYLCAITETESWMFYRIKMPNGSWSRPYRHCWKITEEEGKQRIEEGRLYGAVVFEKETPNGVHDNGKTTEGSDPAKSATDHP